MDGEIYEQHNQNVSFLRDLLVVSGIPVRGIDQERAHNRMSAHAKLCERREAKAHEAATRSLEAYGIHPRTGGPAHTRALSATAGSAISFTPPKWMVESFASIARVEAVLPKLVTTVDLPPACMELHIPRFNSAAGIVPMASENTDAPETPETTDEVTIGVGTFAGDIVISQQMYDRDGDFSDAVALREMASNYGEALQQQMMNGTGTNGQLLGLRSVPVGSVHGVPGAQLVTFTSSSPTPAELARRIGQCAAAISNVRKRPPSAILMRGSRWFDFATSDDENGEPVVRPGTGAAPARTPGAQNDIGPFGPVAGLPVYHDNTLPTNLGAAENQDAIVLARTADTLLLEDPLGPRFNAFPVGAEASQLTVVLQWHQYTASIPHLYPSAIGTVTGTGLAVPVGW
jgi:HK97 family phage major capsid protein